MKKTILAALAAVLLLLSCGTKATGESMAISVSPAEGACKLSEIFSSYEKIELRGKILSDIMRVVKVEGGFVVHSRAGRYTYLDLFDSDGQFVSAVVELGNGRGEVLNVVDVYYDNESQQVEVLVNYGMKVVVYSLSQRGLVDQFDLPKSISASAAFSKLDDDRYIFYKNFGHEDSENYKLFVYNRGSDSVERKYMPFNSEYETLSSFFSLNYLYKNGDDVIFYEPFSDRGYSISRDTISDHFVFDKKEFAVPSNRIDRVYAGGVLEFVEVCKDCGYIYAHINCFQSQNLLFSRYVYEEESYLNVANLDTHESGSYTSIYDDLVRKKDVGFRGYSVVGSDDCGIYMSVSSEEFEDFDMNDTHTELLIFKK